MLVNHESIRAVCKPPKRDFLAGQSPEKPTYRYVRLSGDPRHAEVGHERDPGAASLFRNARSGGQLLLLGGIDPTGLFRPRCEFQS